VTSQAKQMTLKVEPLVPTALEMAPRPNTTTTDRAIPEDARRTYAEVLIRTLRRTTR
jgi:hypothetical protein